MKPASIRGHQPPRSRNRFREYILAFASPLTSRPSRSVPAVGVRRRLAARTASSATLFGSVRRLVANDCGRTFLGDVGSFGAEWASGPPCEGAGGAGHPDARNGPATRVLSPAFNSSPAVLPYENDICDRIRVQSRGAFVARRGGVDAVLEASGRLSHVGPPGANVRLAPVPLSLCHATAISPSASVATGGVI